MAESGSAQAAFRKIIERWYSYPDARARLAPELRRFIDAYPEDAQSRRAVVYLAWIHVTRGELDHARAWLDQIPSSNLGSVRDFSQVVAAEALIQERQASAALDVLRPLKGKLIDTAERMIFQEQLLRALIQVGAWREAIDAMLAWAIDAQEEERKFIHHAIEQFIAEIPYAELQASLTTLTSEGSPEYQREQEWLKDTIVKWLTRHAIERQDTRLARQLLGSQTKRQSAAERVELARLAALGGDAPSIQGRTIGLILNTGSPEREQRSAELARGLTRALGLPQSARQPGQVRLITSYENGEPGELQRAFQELAGAGASLMVTGIDAQAADAANKTSGKFNIPTIVTEPPSGSAPSSALLFIVGEGEAETKTYWQNELANKQRNAAYISAELCRKSPSYAGQPTFPFDAWQRSQVTELLVLGPEQCALELARQIHGRRLTLRLILGWESASALYQINEAVPSTALRAGAFPARPAGSGVNPPPKTMQEFMQSSGAPPTWYASLGHDIGLLARASLERVADTTLEEAVQVSSYHAEVAQALSLARADLWTSGERGFSGERRLKRTTAQATNQPAPQVE